MTPQGQGEVLYFSENWGEKNVSLVDGTDYFNSEDMSLLDSSC
jgi:hypothetical protein